LYWISSFKTDDEVQRPTHATIACVSNRPASKVNSLTNPSTWAETRPKILLSGAEILERRIGFGTQVIVAWTAGRERGRAYILALRDFFSGSSLKIFKSRHPVPKCEKKAFRMSHNETQAELGFRCRCFDGHFSEDS
jgi:hypothetical protein